MTPERYQEVGRLYRAALELDASQRPRYLSEACADDEALRAEVEALLGYQAQGGRLLDQPALELATLVLDEKRVRSLAGQRVGHCQLLSRLGKGGMGEVWLAEDTQLGRRVAVKLLPAEFTQDAERVRRFAQEARAASALNHPNLITIHEIGKHHIEAGAEAGAEAGGTHYIVTEYVEGETLRQRMTSAPQQQLPLSEALDLVMQVAAALTAAHAAGIVHRDIKPENVMVRPDGLVKVLDFGLAKLIGPSAPMVDTQSPTMGGGDTKSGMVMGTPRYMSPEQARGEKVDARTDIFSLGVVLYEMSAGCAPFAGATLSEVIAAILRDEPPPLADHALATPPEFQRIISQALRKNREDRYHTSKDLLSDLTDLKQELEFNAKLERSAQPAAREQAQAASRSEAAEIQTAQLAAADTGKAAEMRTTSSAEYLVGEIKRRKLAVGLTLLLAVVAAAVYFSSFGGSGQAIESLAVLPFINVGANPDTEYLSDGITDSLINRLSQLPRLKVMSRNSVSHYKGREADAQAVGNQLGVQAVLTGRFTQRDDGLSISTELVYVRDNSHLGGEHYNRKLSDLLAVQAELSRDISEKLRLKLSSADTQRLMKRGTENAEAYELYLKGRYSMNSLTDEGINKSLAYFQRAIEKDSRYGPAYAGLAEYYAALAYASATSTIPPKEAFLKAKAAALRAVELDDTLAEAHTSLGMIATLHEWDWHGAEREFKRAIALNPNYVPAHHWYSHYLINLGRFAESLAESQRALALDPLDVAMNFHLGFHYYNARQYEQASAQLQKTLAINQNHTLSHQILGLVYEQQGRYQDAIAEMQKGRELGGGDRRGMMGHMYAIAGQRGEAEKLVAELLEERKHKYISPFNIARIYAGLGEKDQAFAWLEKAYDERDSSLTNIKIDPQFDRLHEDARFQNLLRRIGL